MTLHSNAESERLLAFGDLHGCHQALRALLDQVSPCEEDRLVFLGDYIDRGPEGFQVIDTLLELKQRFPKAIFLKGNHEAMFLDFLSGRNRMLYLLNGGTTTLASYYRANQYPPPKSHMAFLKGLRLFFETEHFIFTHAGMRPGLPLQRQSEHDLLWIREDFLSSDYSWGKIVVFGHTPLDAPLLEPLRIGLDTGAVFGGTLTCCDVKRRQLWQATQPSSASSG